VIRLLCIPIALTLTFATVRAQDTAPPAETKSSRASDIFSGNVKELTPDAVVVVRKIAGKPDETRRFTIDGQTKVEGRLRANARVTIHFQPGSEETAHALRIIVR